MRTFERLVEENQRGWDERTPHHVRSRFYDVAGFEAGRSSLTAIELEEVGDVADKTLLHLQCHFGMDTLSWARLGARVTGLDFSSVAIVEAGRLAARTGLTDRARFVCANVFDAPTALEGETFDLVFTSFGVLQWLPDLGPWARAIAACLRPGGTLHLVEFHPILWMFDDALTHIAHQYDGGGAPITSETAGTYADPGAPIVVREHCWNHGLGTVVGALLAAGLRLEGLRELDHVPFALFPDMHEIAPGKFRHRVLGARIRYVFTLAARGPSPAR